MSSMTTRTTEKKEKKNLYKLCRDFNHCLMSSLSQNYYHFFSLCRFQEVAYTPSHARHNNGERRRMDAAADATRIQEVHTNPFLFT